MGLTDSGVGSQTQAHILAVHLYGGAGSQLCRTQPSHSPAARSRSHVKALPPESLPESVCLITTVLSKGPEKFFWDEIKCTFTRIPKAFQLLKCTEPEKCNADTLLGVFFKKSGNRFFHLGSHLVGMFTAGGHWEAAESCTKKE